jgi:hypothetical protein
MSVLYQRPVAADAGYARQRERVSQVRTDVGKVSEACRIRSRWDLTGGLTHCRRLNVQRLLQLLITLVLLARQYVLVGASNVGQYYYHFMAV